MNVILVSYKLCVYWESYDCLCGLLIQCCIYSFQFYTFCVFNSNQTFFVALRSWLDALFIVMPASSSSYRLSLGVDIRGPCCSPQLVAFLSSAPSGSGRTRSHRPIFIDSEIRVESKVTDLLYSLDHCFVRPVAAYFPLYHGLGKKGCQLKSDILNTIL